jgi:hypothetical protein
VVHTLDGGGGSGLCHRVSCGAMVMVAVDDLSPVDGEKRKREMRCDYGGKKSAIEIDSSIWREEIDAVEG